MSLYRDDGVVLRTQRLGEADRIVTVLTREQGRIRAVAKGVRRTKSRFGGRLEPFTHVEAQFHAGRSLDVVTQVDVIAPYGARVVPDYPRYTVGQAILEAAERLTAEERQPAPRQFLLLVGALRTLAGGEHDPELVLDAFLLRSLAVAGYAPTLESCVQCGMPGPHRSFSVVAGGCACPRCRPHGAATVATETIDLLIALLRGDWDGADDSDARPRREAGGLVAAYLQWHLEREIRSLRLVAR